MRTTITKYFLLLALGLVNLLAMVTAGFQVSGTQIRDANGNNFIMRGTNHPHACYQSQTGSFAQIAATGANTVRVVLANGDQWTRTSASEITQIINLCKTNKLVCVLEVHDATGFGESAAAGTLARAAQFWIDNKAVLVGQENYVIINIANEPFGNNQPASAWINGHTAAIAQLRNAGLTHMLMVDAPNWGQDWQEYMLNNAQTVAAADVLGNTVFSVHMYEVYQSYSKIDSYITRFLAKGLPLVIGEFGAAHNGQPVDADSIMLISQTKGVGYLTWSWSGNGACCTNLDMVNNFNDASLTAWGQRAINGANGIRSTSILATVYTQAASSQAQSALISSSMSSVRSSIASVSSAAVSSASAAAQQCNWYGSLHPICTNTTNGWGWENQQSCIARDTCAYNGGQLVGASASAVSSSSLRSSSVSSSSLRSSSLSSSAISSSASTTLGQCNWYGTRYPLCAGSPNSWGWENQQSCIGRTLCGSVGGL